MGELLVVSVLLVSVSDVDVGVHVLILEVVLHHGLSSLYLIFEGNWFFLVAAMSLHGRPHGLNFFRGQRVIHETEVILGSDLLENEKANVQCHGPCVSAFSINYMAKCNHYGL